MILKGLRTLPTWRFPFTILLSLVQVQNQSFGPKQNAKFTVNHHHHHPPTENFWRVLGFVWGQDSVCRLHIDQRAITPNFGPLSQRVWPPPPQIFSDQKDFGSEKKCWSEQKMLVIKKVLVKKKKFGPKFFAPYFKVFEPPPTIIFFGLKRFCSEKRFWSEKKFWYEKKCCQQKIGSKKNKHKIQTESNKFKQSFSKSTKV